MNPMPRLTRLVREAAVGGRVPPATALGLLVVLARFGPGARSIRRLQVENLRYYRRAIAAGREAVWTSLFSPTELIDAFGLAPLCLEGLAGMLAAAGSEGRFLSAADAAPVPNTLCTFHRVIVGLGQSGRLPVPRLVLSTSALCDGNGVSFRLLADCHKLPLAFLDVPPEPTPAALAYLVEQLHATAALLERVAGRPLDRARLARAVSHSRDAVRLSARLFAVRARMRGNVFRGPEMINLMFPLNAMAGSPALCRVLDGLVREAENATRRSRPLRCIPWAATGGRLYVASIGRPRGAHHRSSPTGAPAVRLLWAHIAPLYNYDRIWSVLDAGERAKVVGEECSHIDETGLDCADDFEFIARRLIGVPQNGTLERRLERLERLRRETAADGIVHFSHWGCHQASGAVPLMERFFASRGVPFLNLSGDCVDSRAASLEQHATRAEAFVESLVSRISDSGH